MSIHFSSQCLCFASRPCVPLAVWLVLPADVCHASQAREIDFTDVRCAVAFCVQVAPWRRICPASWLRDGARRFFPHLGRMLGLCSRVGRVLGTLEAAFPCQPVMLLEVSRPGSFIMIYRPSARAAFPCARVSVLQTRWVLLAIVSLFTPTCLARASGNFLRPKRLCALTSTPVF
ncbi:hypothetical protein C8R44DRAFT_890746 [Mycena epipterygia]|nr:hypothetical protein C8R44DRAFT_890746 [Mycena epipterygia]